MNTFVLAIVALGLVAFLILSRRRRAGAGSAPAERGPSSGTSRRRRRRGAEPASAAPLAAVPEPAASHPSSPLYEAPPLERIAPPIPDWTPHDEMIVEPGWPLPGEIAGSWSAEAAPSATAVAVEEPPADTEDVEPDAVGIAEEWTMPAAGYAERGVEPGHEFASEPGLSSEQDDVEADMEAWVPGVSEIDPAPVQPEPEPLTVWAEAEAEITAAEAPALWAPEPPVLGEDEAAGEPAGPPLWTPPAGIAAPDEPSEVVAAEAEEPVITFEEPAASFEEPAGMAVDEPAWEIAPAPVAAPPAADLHAQSRELADLLARAASGRRALLGASDALGVTPRMLVVLHTLADGPLSLPEQARVLGVSRPVVADICARLEQLGFARRERDARDRRRHLVTLTDRGRRLASETDGKPDPTELIVALERISPMEREALLGALRALNEDGHRL